MLEPHYGSTLRTSLQRSLMMSDLDRVVRRVYGYATETDMHRQFSGLKELCQCRKTKRETWIDTQTQRETYQCSKKSPNHDSRNVEGKHTEGREGGVPRGGRGGIAPMLLLQPHDDPLHQVGVSWCCVYTYYAIYQVVG